jgi:hypothetical protein
MGFWVDYKIELGEPDWAADLDEHAGRHALGCLLARVAGKSPLEYLLGEERARQRDVVVSLMNNGYCDSVSTVIPEFLSALDPHASN